MRILVISPTFPPKRSGGSDYAFRLSKELANRGNEVDVLTSSDLNGPTPPVNFTLHRAVDVWSWAALTRILLLVARLRPDVVNIHFIGAVYDFHPMITFIPFLAKKLRRKVRVVTVMENIAGCHFTEGSWLGSIATRLLAKAAGGGGVDEEFGTLFSHSDELIILSETHRAMIAARDPAVGPKCVCLPPPPAVKVVEPHGELARNRGRELLSIDPTTQLIGYFGYLYPEKGLETLFRALALVARELPNVRLVIVGSFNQVVLDAMKLPDYPQHLDELAAELGIAERVTYSGYFENEDETPSLYLRACDIGVLPFDRGVYLNNSSFNTLAVHAMPIISTRAPDTEGEIANGENVLLCAPRDAEALSERILVLLRDDKLRAHLGRGAGVLAERFFSWATTAEVVLRGSRAAITSTSSAATPATVPAPL